MNKTCCSLQFALTTSKYFISSNSLMQVRLEVFAPDFDSLIVSPQRKSKLEKKRECFARLNHTIRIGKVFIS